MAQKEVGTSGHVSDLADFTTALVSLALKPKCQLKMPVASQIRQLVGYREQINVAPGLTWGLFCR